MAPRNTNIWSYLLWSPVMVCPKSNLNALLSSVLLTLTPFYLDLDEDCSLVLGTCPIIAWTYSRFYTHRRRYCNKRDHQHFSACKKNNHTKKYPSNQIK